MSLVIKIGELVGRSAVRDIARLEWLKYWLHWAIENCEKPTFYCE